jgi:hypothetical protein
MNPAFPDLLVKMKLNDMAARTPNQSGMTEARLRRKNAELEIKARKNRMVLPR